MTCSLPETLAAVLLCLPSSIGVGGSSARTAAGADGAREQPDYGRTTTWVLRLREGGVLRARARLRAAPGEPAGPERWEVRAGGAWRELPAGSVVSAVPEADLLREARARERELGREPALDARASHVAWLADAGLALEALRALDELASEAPDDPRVRALCADPALPLAVPRLGRGEQGLERFLDELAGGGPVLRERALASLDPLASAEGARDPGPLAARLAADLAHPRSERRALAAFLHRRLLPGRRLEPLFTRALADPSPAVRREACRSLAVARDPRVLGTFVRLLEAGSDEARLRSVQALAAVGHPAAVQPLVALLQRVSDAGRGGGGLVSFGTWTAFVGDFDVEVAQGQAVADPGVRVVGSGASLGARVLATTGTGALAGAVRDALEQLTGERPGRTSRSWLAWWDAEGARWMAAHPAPTGDERTRPRSPGGS